LGRKVSLRLQAYLVQIPLMAPNNAGRQHPRFQIFPFPPRKRGMFDPFPEPVNDFETPPGRNLL